MQTTFGGLRLAWKERKRARIWVRRIPGWAAGFLRRWRRRSRPHSPLPAGCASSPSFPIHPQWEGILPAARPQMPSVALVSASGCHSPASTSGRNKYYGPGLQNWNFAVAKVFPLGTERVRLRLRADFFNLFSAAEAVCEGTTYVGPEGPTP